MKMRRGLAAPYARAAMGAAGALLLSHGAHASTAPTPCQQLSGITLPLDGTASQVSIFATDIPAQTFNGLNIPTFCYVALDVSSNANPSQSQIQMIFGLPEGSAWNGRFVGTGNGGFAGAVSLPSAALYVAQGYAAANNDLGTGTLFQCNTAYCGSAEGVAGTPTQTPGGLYGDAAAITDFGYGATHLMTLAGKQLVLAYYGTSPSYSYFHGCSTGGQQALMEAQRFPTDYNGILAGSPAYNRTHLHIASAALYEETHIPGTYDPSVPGGVITAAGAALVHNAMLASCAGTDGGLSTDGFLTQPNKCTFSATTLLCNGTKGEVPCTDPNGTSCTCLTGHEALAMDADWAGAKDSNNHVLFPGYERGVEGAPISGDGILAQEYVSEPLFDSLDYWAFGPSFTWQSLFNNTTTAQRELASQIAALDTTPVDSAGTFASVLNADSGNLSAFAEAGGKLVMYAGYADPLIPSASSFDYFNTVAKDDPQYNYYLRLYMAPGMWHCGGGPGANIFGNLAVNPNAGNPKYDVFAALTNWVENGLSQAPKSVIATKFTNDTIADGVAFQRPLCPYPQNAQYVSGDATQASSWKCATGKFVTNQPFWPAYGPQ